MDDKYLIDKLDAIEDKIEELDKPVKYKIETNDKEEHWMAFHGADSYYALWDLDQYLRGKIKYGAEEESLDSDTLQHCRDKLTEFMQDKGIDFEHIS